MRKYIVILYVFIAGMNYSQSQIDSSFFTSYDSTINYYVFKPTINLPVVELVDQKPTLFGLSDNNLLRLYNIDRKESGAKIYRFRQYYNSIKIDDSQFFIHSNSDDKPLFAIGELCQGININISTTISPENAINSALNYANAEKYFWQDTSNENMIKEIMKNPDTSFYPTAELVIINLHTGNKHLTPIYKLVYKVPIFSLTPYDSYFLYIDAIDGVMVRKNKIMTSSLNNFSNSMKSLKFFNEKRNYDTNTDTCYDNNSAKEINTCSQQCTHGNATTIYYNDQDIYTEKYWYELNCTHRLKDNCTGTTLYVVKRKKNQNYGYSDYRDISNSWGNDHDIGTTALWCLERIHDFFRSAPYYRNSINGNNLEIKVFTECNIISEAVHWTGLSIEIGVPLNDVFSNQMTTLDIIGHEFTHGIDDCTANLSYQAESGAISESFGDIFGTMVDFYGKTNYNTGLQPNYTLGEECAVGGKLRDMSNPHSCGQPTTYGAVGHDWFDLYNCYPDDNNDYCGVHTNSGVMNYWFYLLSEGSGGVKMNDIGDEYCVLSIGRDKAALIAWKALTELMDFNDQFCDARNKTILAASQLFGQNSFEVSQVTHAWYAVGVPSIYGNNPSPYNGVTQINNYIASVPIPGNELFAFNNEVVFNNLQVPVNKSLTVTSDTKITMKTNSRASSNSYFNAYIAPACTGGAKRLEIPSSNLPSSEELISEIINEKIKQESGLLIIPNPSQGIFTIQFSNGILENANLQVFNVLGNIVHEAQLKNQQTQQIDLSGLAEGMYYVRIYNGERSWAEKVVIQR